MWITRNQLQNNELHNTTSQNHYDHPQGYVFLIKNATPASRDCIEKVFRSEPAISVVYRSAANHDWDSHKN